MDEASNGTVSDPSKGFSAARVLLSGSCGNSTTSGSEEYAVSGYDPSRESTSGRQSLSTLGGSSSLSPVSEGVVGVLASTPAEVHVAIVIVMS